MLGIPNPVSDTPDTVAVIDFVVVPDIFNVPVGAFLSIFDTSTYTELLGCVPSVTLAYTFPFDVIETGLLYLL